MLMRVFMRMLMFVSMRVGMRVPLHRQVGFRMLVRVSLPGLV